MSKMVSIGLHFGGVLLPIVECADGFERVPLKPICDEVGVDWETQRKKVQVGYLSRRLGVCTEPVLWAGQTREMVVIRIDRVEAYLNTLNPEQIRSAGNIDSADWLEAKHAEWDNVLHAWESGRRLEVQSKMTAALRRAGVIARIDAIKNPALRRIALLEIGIDPDLIEPTGPKNQGDLFKAA